MYTCFRFFAYRNYNARAADANVPITYVKPVIGKYFRFFDYKNYNMGGNRSSRCAKNRYASNKSFFIKYILSCFVFWLQKLYICKQQLD